MLGIVFYLVMAILSIVGLIQTGEMPGPRGDDRTAHVIFRR